MRFCPINDRPFVSLIHGFKDLSAYEAVMKRGKCKWQKWKGRALLKDPMTLSILQQLLSELKPRSILEFGTFEGGSTVWMRDMTNVLDFPCELHTFDIDAARADLDDEQGITFHKLNNHQIQIFHRQNHQLFANLPRPILVIEDAHQNVTGVLTAIDKCLHSGDYLIVEDTLEPWKHNELIKFLSERSYSVDTLYCDFWGLNNSWNVNAYLRKD